MDSDGMERATPLVGIGASAGGLEALTSLVAALPSDSGMSFFVVQHLDPNQPSALIELLARAGPLKVVEACDGAVPEADTMYVGPPGAQLTMDESAMRLQPNGKAFGHPIDAFLRSLAQSAGRRGIGVLLSGSGTDGRLGLTAVREAGGFTLAQDDTAKFHGMPHAAINAGVVDRVLPPARIASELVSLRRHPYVRGEAISAEEKGDDASAGDALAGILRLVRSRHGVDFAGYKHSTVDRRIQRRMALRRVQSLTDYANMLASESAEVDALFGDILINVTEFFRDPEMFDGLRSEVLDRIFDQHDPEVPLRIWVVGCSTGEEAYSLAMTVLEYQRETGRDLPIKIFGTDVSDAALATARLGTYPPERCAQIDAGRREKYFTRVAGGLQVRKNVRELCVFARHDVTCDPPFSRMDLVTCRNVLIYLGGELQRRVVPILHYSLRPGGVLVLGKAESIGRQDELFELLNNDHRFYARRASSRGVLPDLPLMASLPAVGTAEAAARASHPELLERQADRLVLARYAPAGVVLDADLRVLQFRGETSPFLANAPGSASFHVLKMAHEDLHTHLSDALEAAAESGAQTVREDIRIRAPEGESVLTLRVLPLDQDGTTGYLVLFEVPHRVPALPSRLGAVAREYGRWIIRRLEQSAPKGAAPRDYASEVAATRARLHGLIDEHEAKTEELKAANEEVLSSNEELQSTNEELQTAKEEVQATNEELSTVNEELEARNAMLSRVNDDLANLLSSTNIPIVMVGQDRQIRRFTPSAERILNLIPGDIGRPLDHVKSDLNLPSLGALVDAVLEDLSLQERETQDSDGKWYRVTASPYRTADNKIDGAVVAIMDIDVLKRAEATLLQERTYAQQIVETVRAPLVIVDDELNVVSANPAYHRTLGTTPEAVEGRPFDTLNPDWSDGRLHEWLRGAIASGTAVEELELTTAGDRPRELRLSAQRIAPTHDEALLLVAVEDVTSRREDERRDAELVAGVLEAQAVEREHLARELHDETGQALSALLVGLRAVAEQMEDEAARALVHELRERVRELLGVGRLARGLHPTALEELGLLGAIGELVESFGHAHAIEAKLETEGDERFAALPSAMQLALYRVIQEGLTNVGRHARATVATVELRHNEKEVMVRVADDGRGFDPDSDTPTGIGLRLMKRRVAQMGGSFSLYTVPGDGTVLDIVVPVPRSDE